MKPAEKPRLRVRPPAGPVTAADAKAAEQWSEEPARAAAAALAAPPAKPKKGVKVEKPWLVVDEGQPTGKRAVSYRFPVELYQQLAFLAETTYGYDQTRIVVEAVQEKVNAMLKVRGLT